MKNFTLCLLGFLLITFSSEAQILDKIKKVKNSITSVTVDKLSKDPVTTSFKDVDKTKYVEDGFGDDAVFLSLFDQPYIDGSGFSLTPGFYEGEFQSFCIKAGTYYPKRGSGRFYAPLKGPKADIFEHIITQYERNPNITQKEVQLLLWAIIAKTNFSKMSGEVKLIATKLLNPEQIARLSKGALDKIARKELQKIAYSSDAVRAIIQAENDLRSKFYSGVSSYEEYERIAMIPGEESLVAGFEPGRWTKHPEGFFIRYFPHGYSKTHAQVYVPDTDGTRNFNPSTAIAVPAGSGQRLLQTILPPIDGGPNIGGGIGNPGGGTIGGGGTSGGGTVGDETNLDEFCTPAFHAGVDKVVKEQMIMQDLPGVAVAVYKNGKMVHLKAYGYRDIYTEDPITLNTKMEWASISKSVTGVAAAQLEERGIGGYKVTDKADKYIENWKSVDWVDTTGTKSGRDARPPSISIDQLLNNTSGIQQYGKGKRKDKNAFYADFGRDTYIKFVEKPDNYSSDPGVFNSKKAVDVFNESVLDFNPGSKWHYSSYGFVLAGATIDKVAPNGYVDWVQKNIANVASMSSFGIAQPPGKGHQQPQDGMLRVVGSGRAEHTLPAGGYESNICDLAKYSYALSTGKFLKNKKDQLWNNSVTAMVNSSLSYSYGLYFKSSGPNFRVYHGGHGGNSRSYMQFFPSDSTGIAIMAPAVYSDLPYLASHIFQELSIRPSVYSGETHTPLDKCRSGMDNGEDLFHGVWRRTGDDVLIRTGYETEIFFKEIKRLQSSGYECVDVETFTNGGKRYWDAVLKKNVPIAKLIHDVPLDLFLTTTNALKNEGYILRDVESYLKGSSGRRWTGVFSKENKQNVINAKNGTQELRDLNNTNAGNGLKLVDIECYPDGNLVNWTGVWVEGDASKLELNLVPADFFEMIKTKRRDGYRLVDVEYYMLNNQEWRVGAVWEIGSKKEFVTGESGDSLSLQKFCDHMLTHHDQSRAGLELVDWERIDVEWFND